MPVLDHPVHPLTKIGPDHRYACHNRPDRLKQSYIAPDRQYRADGKFDIRYVSIPFRLSHECRYDGKGGLTEEDPGCEGCRHYKGSDYVKSLT